MSHEYKHSHLHKEEIKRSTFCGCYCCCKIYHSNDIKEWCDNGNTAICPQCGVDAVIGDKSGLPITVDFLIDSYKRWFMV